MKLRFSNFGIGMLLGVFLAGGIAFAKQEVKTAEQIFNDIKIVVNGSELTPKDSKGEVVEPFVIQGTTYLPVRAVAEALEMDVVWDGEAKTVSIDSKRDSEKNASDANEIPPNGQNNTESKNESADNSGESGSAHTKGDFVFTEKHTTKYEELFDWTITTGTVKNQTGKDYALIIVGVTYYGEDGTVLGKGSAVVQDIKNGVVKSFETLASGKHNEAAEIVFQIDSKI